MHNAAPNSSYANDAVESQDVHNTVPSQADIDIVHIIDDNSIEDLKNVEIKKKVKCLIVN